jgi:hypothetical protein
VLCPFVCLCARSPPCVPDGEGSPVPTPEADGGLAITLSAKGVLDTLQLLRTRQPQLFDSAFVDSSLALGFMEAVASTGSTVGPTVVPAGAMSQCCQTRPCGCTAAEPICNGMRGIVPDGDAFGWGQVDHGCVSVRVCALAALAADAAAEKEPGLSTADGSAGGDEQQPQQQGGGFGFRAGRPSDVHASSVDLSREDEGESRGDCDVSPGLGPRGSGASAADLSDGDLGLSTAGLPATRVRDLDGGLLPSGTGLDGDGELIVGAAVVPPPAVPIRPAVPATVSSKNAPLLAVNSALVAPAAAPADAGVPAPARATAPAVPAGTVSARDPAAGEGAPSGLDAVRPAQLDTASLAAASPAVGTAAGGGRASTAAGPASTSSSGLSMAAAPGVPAWVAHIWLRQPGWRSEVPACVRAVSCALEASQNVYFQKRVDVEAGVSSEDAMAAHVHAEFSDADVAGTGVRVGVRACVRACVRLCVGCFGAALPCECVAWPR